jgi:hypothetical protein
MFHLCCHRLAQKYLPKRFCFAYNATAVPRPGVRISAPFLNPGAVFFALLQEPPGKFSRFKNALIAKGVMEISGLNCDGNSEGCHPCMF